jgi:glycosyltransferase involved in cell wall biosynthesis
MKRVLRITSSMNPKLGGVVSAVDQCARYFIGNESFSVEVLCFDDPVSPWFDDVEYTVHAIGRSYSGYGFNLKYIPWLIKNARSYDFVFFDGIWQWHLVGAYILKLLSVPYVVVTHGMLDVYFNKFFFKYLKKLPFWFFVDRNALSLSKGVVFSCQQEYLCARSSFPLAKIEPLINRLGIDGIDGHSVDADKASVFGFGSEFLVGLFLSRIHPKKGLDILISAICDDRWPSHVCIAIAGPDDSGMVPGYKEVLAKSCKEKNVVWLGMLSGKRKVSAFKLSDFFILPSHQENFGLVIAEALSVGRFIITTDKVNIHSILTDGEAAFVSSDTVDGIINSVTSYVSCSVEERVDMSRRAFNCYQNNFTSNVSSNDMMKIVTDLCR